jgi:uncharacterized protein with HEPN domain
VLDKGLLMGDTGIVFEDFCHNDMAVYAVIRNFEVIGEAAKRVLRGDIL